MLKALLDIFFPPHCHLCKAFIADADDLHLCPTCNERITLLASPLCTVCGRPFHTESDLDHRCGKCLSDPPPFTAARAACLYEEGITDLIHSFKYRHKTHLRLPLAILAERQLAEYFLPLQPQLVIPVPLHRLRLRQRGFNQALLLAEVLSGKWKIPLSRANLQRIRWTEPQINLPAAERAKNVQGAFAVASPEEVDGKRVLLIDDVFTTGSTVGECAKVLKKGGAVDVYVLTVASAVL